MDLARWIDPIIAVIAWITVFVLIKPQRIKELLPAALLPVIVLFIAEEYIITLGMYKYNKALLFIWDMPLTHLLWGAAGGIIVMHYMPREFSKKIPVILLFAAGVMLLGYAEMLAGNRTISRMFTPIHDYLQNVGFLFLFAWLVEGLFGNRIHGEDVKIS